MYLFFFTIYLNHSIITAEKFNLEDEVKQLKILSESLERTREDLLNRF